MTRQFLSSTTTLMACALFCIPAYGQNQIDAQKVRLTCDKVAAAYRLESGDGRRFELIEKSQFAWSKNTYEDVYGNVYIWTDQTVPVAIASIFQFVRPKDDVDSEFHSLSSKTIVAKIGSNTVWTPSAGGITYDQLKRPDSVGATSVHRKAQMRSIARQFRAMRKDTDEGTTQLRLLSTPIYHYSSAEKGVLDGAIFAFVDQTDPEVWLIIEARTSSDGKRWWQYATARMNTNELLVYHQESMVHRATPTERYDDPKSPYVIFQRLQDDPRFGVQ